MSTRFVFLNVRFFGIIFFYKWNSSKAATANCDKNYIFSGSLSYTQHTVSSVCYLANINGFHECPKLSTLYAAHAVTQHCLGHRTHTEIGFSLRRRFSRIMNINGVYSRSRISPPKRKAGCFCGKNICAWKKKMESCNVDDFKIFTP